MDSSHNLSSFSCELNIIGARNIEVNSHGDLFVRCYLSKGNNNSVRLDSKPISSKSDLSWNESFSLDCSGSQNSMDLLMQGSLIFQLRYRANLPILGTIGASRLLGEAEILWKTVFESPQMEIEKWVTVVQKNGHVKVDLQPPSVLRVGVKVKFRKTIETRTRSDKVEGCSDCGCENNCGGYDCMAECDMFALAAVLDAF